MDSRIDFFQNLIKDKSKRILELGPLNRPIADKNIYPNTFYCDIRSTEDVRRLYSGNDYLKATGIMINPEEIVPIDLVIQGTYTKTLKNIEKFDYVIASHVLEHMEDLIFSFQDISSILKPDGIFCIIYPDKRYCFDHFRVSSSFRDAYNVFRNGTKENAPMVFDFFYSVIPENNPKIFWDKKGILNYMPTSSYENAVDHYEQVLKGVRMDDVHYWPFSDMDFLKFLYDCTRAGLLPFRCIAFQPCRQNDQQFMLALQYDQKVLSDPDYALKDLIHWMKYALPDYYSSIDIVVSDENKNLWTHLNAQNEQLESQTQDICNLNSQINKHMEIEAEQEHTIIVLKNQLYESAQNMDNYSQLLEKKQEEINDYSQRLKKRQKDIDDYRELSEKRQEEINNLTEEKNILHQELERRMGQLELMENSRSWRLTEPLRALASVWKNLRN